MKNKREDIHSKFFRKRLKFFEGKFLFTKIQCLTVRLEMKLELDEFKTGTKNVMLKVVFEETTNFWLDKDKGKATWVPKYEEVKKIEKALEVINSGNKVVNSINARSAVR